MSTGASPLICPAVEGARHRNHLIWMDSKCAPFCEWVLLHCFDGGSRAETSPWGSVDQMEEQAWRCVLLLQLLRDLRRRVQLLLRASVSPRGGTLKVSDSHCIHAAFLPNSSPPKKISSPLTRFFCSRSLFYILISVTLRVFLLL